MPTRIQIRRSAASAWQTANPVLADGEIGLENDTGRLKIGDAVTPWTALGYALDKAFSAEEKAKLDGIEAGATAAGVVGDYHATRADNPHFTTPAQIGAEPAGAVAAHAAAANAHSIGSISGLQEALDAKIGAISLQMDGDPARLVTGLNLTGAASITSVAAGVATVVLTAASAEPQELSADGAISSSICLVDGTAATVSLPSTSSGLKYTTVKNRRAGSVAVVGTAGPLPYVQGVQLDTSTLTTSQIIASRGYVGILNNKYLLISVIVRPDVQTARNILLFTNSTGLGSNGVEVGLLPNAAKENAKALTIRATSGSTTPMVDVRYNIQQGITQHWLISIDLSVPRIQFARDGILQTPYSTVMPVTGNENLAWGSNPGKTFYVGGHGATPFPWRGSMAQLYVNVAAALDLSIASNVAKFYDGIQPVDLGPDGSLPTGSPPEIFLNDTADAFFTAPKAGAPFTIDPAVVAGNWIAAPAGDALSWPQVINGYPTGYTLPAGEPASFVRTSNGSWEVL